MQKPITTATHGAIDFVTVGTLGALPRVFGWNNGLTNFVTGAAAGMLTYSLLTKYELGLYRVLPMPGHLALDGLSATGLAAAPFLFGEKDVKARGLLMGIALGELVISALTITRPTATSQVAQVLGRKAGKGAWAIGKQTEPSTWAKATKWLGKFGWKAA